MNHWQQRPVVRKGDYGRDDKLFICQWHTLPSMSSIVEAETRLRGGWMVDELGFYFWALPRLTGARLSAYTAQGISLQAGIRSYP